MEQTKAVAIVGGTLIDGTGRAPLEDSAVVILNGRIQAVGKRGELAIPQGAEVIDAKGKSILPGLIDGHCHYRDWMGEVYLAYGVVTCPNISNNPVEWIIAQREGVKNGSIRGPRVWASANIIDGPPPEGTGTLRRQRTSIIVDSEDEARKAVRDLVDKGRRRHQTLRAAKAAGSESGSRRSAQARAAGVRPLARYFYRGGKRLSVRRAFLVGGLHVDPRPEKEKRSRHRTHARKSRYRRSARADGTGDVRQDHQSHDREKRALEHDLGDVVSPAVDPRRRDEAARAGAA